MTPGNRKGAQSEWKWTHYISATILNLHVHPSLKVSLFNRAFAVRTYSQGRVFDPFKFRSNYPMMAKSDVDAASTVVHTSERVFMDECKFVP